MDNPKVRVLTSVFGYEPGAIVDSGHSIYADLCVMARLKSTITLDGAPGALKAVQVCEFVEDAPVVEVDDEAPAVRRGRRSNAE